MCVNEGNDQIVVVSVRKIRAVLPDMRDLMLLPLLFAI